MTNLVIDLFVLILVLIGTGAVLFGWGNLTWRCLGMSLPIKLSTLTIWLGFCVVLSVLELIHLFVPINWLVTIGVAAVGFFGLWYKTSPPVRNVLNTLIVAFKQYPWQSLIVIIMILLWCMRAMGVPNNYDSGLYHFQSIRWLNEEPIVLGLGNLHWRLALNQAYFGFLALLNFAPFWNKGYATGGLFLLILTLLTIFQIAQKQTIQWKYSIGLVLFLSLGFVAASIVNPSPDNPVTLLEIVLFLYLFLLAQSVAKEGEKTPDYVHCATAVSFLCVVVVLTKFSSVGFAIGCILCLALMLLRSKTFARVMTIRAILVLTLFISVHMLRGYFLSGAPLFPSTILGAWQLPWAVPSQVAITETEMIFSWARRQGLDFASQGALNGGWFFAWIQATSPLLKWGFVLSLFLMCLNTVRFFKSKQAVVRRSASLLYMPILIGLLFWFMTAPDVRFLGANHVLFFSLSLYLTLQSQGSNTVLGSRIQRLQKNRHVGLLVFMIVVLISIRYLGTTSLSFSGWSEVPQISTESRQTKAGQNINVPMLGNQCWDSVLPCASIFNNALNAEKNRMYMIFSVKSK